MYVLIVTVLLCFCGYSSQEIKVDFSEPCLTLRDLLCRRYGVRNPSLCGLRYEGIAVIKVVLNWLRIAAQNYY